jgi:hypothetical protein
MRNKSTKIKNKYEFDWQEMKNWNLHNKKIQRENLFENSGKMWICSR